MTETVIQKVQSLQRCIKRAREIFARNESEFTENYDAQDAALLNVIRTCELSIDLANYVIKRDKLGIPLQAPTASNFSKRQA